MKPCVLVGLLAGCTVAFGVEPKAARVNPGERVACRWWPVAGDGAVAVGTFLGALAVHDKHPNTVVEAWLVVVAATFLVTGWAGAAWSGSCNKAPQWCYVLPDGAHHCSPRKQDCVGACFELR